MNPLLLDLPTPILTPRLRLQPRSIGEGEKLNRAICSSLDHLKPWMPFAQTAPTVAESEEHCRRSFAKFILREDLTLSIYTRDGQHLIGSTGLHRPNWEVPSFHIGYWICREYQGQGYVTEAVNAVARYAFAILKARRLEIRCDSKNSKSLAVMQRLAFEKEALIKNDVRENGELRDTIVTALFVEMNLPPLDVIW
jgi:ribosomal-protein-serine acetyltransferase